MKKQLLLILLPASLCASAASPVLIVRTASSDMPVPVDSISSITLSSGSVEIGLRGGKTMNIDDTDFVSLRFDANHPTAGLRLPESANEPSRRYDLAGRRVTNPRGIYLETNPEGKTSKKLKK